MLDGLNLGMSQSSGLSVSEQGEVAVAAKPHKLEAEVAVEHLLGPVSLPMLYPQH